MTGWLKATIGRRPLGAVVALLLVVVATASFLRDGAESKTYYAYFTEVKGLYVGDDVDMLGVRIGRVTAIEPEPTQVKVTLEVQGQRVPADAKAVLVAPSLVSVRHVALAPVYDGGPELADQAVIPISRTAVPVEWNEVKDQLVRLTRALGPKGANRRGALNRALKVGANNLDGRGGQMHRTIELLADAATTLAESGGDLFATVRNLEVFVSALEASHDVIGQFNRSLASASQVVAADSDDLAKVLDALDGAFVKVRRFLKDNRTGLTDTVKGLGRASSLLARNRQKLADILQVAPGTVSNFYNIYDPQVPGLTGSFALPNLDSPAMFLCSAVYSLGRSPADCEALLEPIAQYLSLPFPPVGLGSPMTPGGTNPYQNPDAPAAGADSTTGSGGGTDDLAPSLIDLLGRLGGAR